MDDHRTSQDVTDVEPLIVERRPRVSLIGEKRDHVAEMVRMHGTWCAEMRTDICEIVGAVPVLMNMHRKKSSGARLVHTREIEKFDFH